MITRRYTAMAAFTAVLAVAGCDETPTDTDIDPAGEAVVEGEVQETSPETTSPSGEEPAQGGEPENVSVVTIGATGEYTILASGDVDASGIYRVEGVAGGRTNTAVVAWVDDRPGGEVLIHGAIEGGTTVRPAPITHETTLEARAFARVVASGRADQTSSNEVALFLYTRDLDVTGTLASEPEVDAIAQASAEAGATLGSVFAGSGVDLGAEARGEAVLSATVGLVADLLAGLPLEAANQDFIDAAIDAYTGAGATLQSVVVASASAATIFDAQLQGQTGIRGHLSIQPVLLNLRARQRVAAELGTSAEAAVAAAVEASVVGTEAALATVETAAELRSTLEARLTATIDATADAVVEHLAADAPLTTRTEVRVAAEAALAEAALAARLERATTASTAASAVADLRAEVRAAVQTMVDAAGDSTADVDVLTDLFIAACAGAHIT